MNKCLILLTIFSLASATAVSAEIYKWVDAEGTVHYSDKPAKNAKPADLPQLQGIDKQSTKALKANRASSAAAGSADSSLKVEIVRPLPEETFRDGRGLVSAQAAISPGLGKGQSLVFYLDGLQTAGSPTQSTSLQLEGVVRGEHRLSVAVVAGGQEIARSAPVVFFMKPPTVLTPVSQTAPNAQEQQPAGTTTAPPSVRSPGTPAAPRFGTSTGAAGAPGS